MAIYVLKDCKIYFGGYDISGKSNSVTFNTAAEILDDTTFGASTRSRLVGLTHSDFNIEGFQDLGDDGTPSSTLYNSVGAAVEELTICPTDGTNGERAYFFQAVTGQYNLGTEVGQIAPFTFSGESDGPFIAGKVLYVGTVSEGTTSTDVTFPAVTAAQYVYGVMHITARTSPTNFSCIVQSDDNANFTDPTTQITLSSDAIGAVWGTPKAGAITDTHWRISASVDSGSATIFVAIGIR